jgi:3-oxoacyl-[acyl-carrier-protein] synthase-1/3-oxoacyl-[acyl-carrier-protein] synthase II
LQPLKAQIGHTLGAAGVLETIAAGLALEADLVPGAVLSGALDPACPVRLLAATASLAEASPAVAASGQACVLKVSAAFGGSNAALVLGRTAPTATGAGVAASRPSLRAVYLSARARVVGGVEARVALEQAGVPPERLAKLDSLSLLACGAVAELVRGGARVAGAGVVAGHALATLDIDERFFSRILVRGAGAGEPRTFPATSPNVCAGHAAILFGLTGPSAATCGGLDGGAEALALASDLIAAGDADAIVVVAVDELGPAGAEVLRRGFPAARAPAPGAVAALLTATPGPGRVEVPLGSAPLHEGPLVGHEALTARLDALQS